MPDALHRPVCDLMPSIMSLKSQKILFEVISIELKP